MLKRRGDEKVISMNATEYKGNFVVLAVTESGAVIQNAYDLNEKKWGDWTIVSIPAPNK